MKPERWLLLAYSLGSMAQAPTALAVQAYNDVWFPSGQITYAFRGITDQNAINNIRAALCYLEQRTPLDFREARSSRFNQQGPQTRDDQCDSRQLRTPAVANNGTSSGALYFRGKSGTCRGLFSGITPYYWNKSGVSKAVYTSRPWLPLLFGTHAKSINFCLTTSASSTAVLPTTGTALHEIGHALGFTHEFQRPNPGAVGVSVPTQGNLVESLDVITSMSFARWFAEEISGLGFDNVALQPALLDYEWNYGVPAASKVQILTPYDMSSAYATGYNGVVSPPHNGPPFGPGLSRHDINAIYRVYGEPFARTVAADEQFGQNVALGDFDGDRMDDLVVASLGPRDAAGTQAVRLGFFKGFLGGDQRQGFTPWFEFEGGRDGPMPRVPVQDARIALAVGDFHRGVPMCSGTVWRRTLVRSGSDGVDEVIVGLPGVNGGHVRFVTVNVNHRFGLGDPSFGGQGTISDRDAFGTAPGLTSCPGTPGLNEFAAARRRVRARDVGLDPQLANDFGAALTVGWLESRNSTTPYLIIGAPGAPVTGVGGVTINTPQGGLSPPKDASRDRQASASTELTVGSAEMTVNDAGRVYLLRNGVPDAQRIVLDNPAGPVPSRFGESLTVLTRSAVSTPGQTNDADLVVAGAPAEPRGNRRDVGAVYVFDGIERFPGYERTNNERRPTVPVSPSLTPAVRSVTPVVLARIAKRRRGGRFGASLSATRITRADGTPVHALAIGQPLGGAGENPPGRAWIELIDPAGTVSTHVRVDLPDFYRSDGAQFGASIAFLRTCRDVPACANQSLRLFVGAPTARKAVTGFSPGAFQETDGAVYAWEVPVPGADGDLHLRAPIWPENGSGGRAFGSSLAAFSTSSASILDSGVVVADPYGYASNGLINTRAGSVAFLVQRSRAPAIQLERIPLSRLTVPDARPENY